MSTKLKTVLIILSAIAPLHSYAVPLAIWKKVALETGESLSQFSNRVYGSSRLWSEIFDANRAGVKSPNDLLAGQRIIVPHIRALKLARNRLRYIYKVSHIEEVRMQIAEELGITYLSKSDATPIVAPKKEQAAITPLSPVSDEIGSLAPAIEPDSYPATVERSIASVTVENTSSSSPDPVSDKKSDPGPDPMLPPPMIIEFKRFDDWEVPN